MGDGIMATFTNPLKPIDVALDQAQSDAREIINSSTRGVQNPYKEMEKSLKKFLLKKLRGL